MCAFSTTLVVAIPALSTWIADTKSDLLAETNCATVTYDSDLFKKTNKSSLQRRISLLIGKRKCS